MKGIVATGPREIGLSPDHRQCRFIVVDEAGEEFFIQMDTAELEAFIPLLARATAVAQGDGDTAPAIPVVDAEVAANGEEEALLTLRTDTGADFVFSLSRRTAVDIGEALRRSGAGGDPENDKNL